MTFIATKVADNMLEAVVVDGVDDPPDPVPPDWVIFSVQTAGDTRVEFVEVITDGGESELKRVYSWGDAREEL